MRRFSQGWSLYERLWLLVFCGIAAAVTILSGDTPFGFSVFLSGVLCVILAAKGNILNYLVGMYNTFGYAWMAYQNGLYGEMGLNLFFYVPMNILGFFMWRKHIHAQKLEMRKMSVKALLGTALACVLSILAMGYALSLIAGQNTPYIDATTNVLSVAATLLMVWRFREQWFAYIILNLFTVIMWSIRTAHGSPEGPMMLVMWSAYLINAVYGLLVWTRGANETEAAR